MVVGLLIVCVEQDFALALIILLMCCLCRLFLVVAFIIEFALVSQVIVVVYCAS